LFKKAEKEKKISGTMLRNMIKEENSSWREYVPSFVYHYINSHSLQKLIIGKN